MKKNLIFDFDSTIIKTEGLEELARISLESRPDGQDILKKIEEITELGMSGNMTFQTSLEKRLQLINPTVEDLERLNNKLLYDISESVKRNVDFFMDDSYEIYILSGGFVDFIFPVSDYLNLEKSRIFANRFLFQDDLIVGFDFSNPLSSTKGKPEVVRTLGLFPDVTYVIGDGFTDFEIKQQSLAKYFIAFTENKKREVVTQNSDFEAKSLDEVIKILKDN